MRTRIIQAVAFAVLVTALMLTAGCGKKGNGYSLPAPGATSLSAPTQLMTSQ
jgi:predicted small lipoprotein YifL